jgi:fatty acid-binding protein DegV
VHHLAAAERADRLATEVRGRLPGLRELYVSELGAAIGAHVGPGAVGIVVAPSTEEHGADGEAADEVGPGSGKD